MVSTPKPIKKTQSKPAGSTSTVPLPGRATRTAIPGAKAKDVKLTDSKAAVATAAAAATSAFVASAVAEPNADIGHSSNATALKKKDLIDRVVASTGAKKKLVKDIVEATLTVLGDALSKGDTLNIPPFGKAKVSRPQEAGTRNAMTVKLRRTTGGGQGGGQGSGKSKQSLADAEE